MESGDSSLEGGKNAEVHIQATQRKRTPFSRRSGRRVCLSWPVCFGGGGAVNGKLKVLDLFCGAGGASMGLHRAGFDVTGIDINPQPRYPFKFIQANALKPPVKLEDYDLIWASPPCQAYSKTRAIHGKDYPNLIPRVRQILEESEVPWIIENVPGAPLRDPIMLCGTMFGLRVIRHRLFETSFSILFLPQCGRHGATNSHRGYSTGAEFVTVAGNNYRRTEGMKAMGIDWYVTRPELSQAIPPAYSEFIGRAALQWMEKAA